MTINDWGSDDPAEVAKGGTAATTFTAGGVLVGKGTAAPETFGPITSGNTLIGVTGNRPAIATLTGTANEIQIIPGSGSIQFVFPSPVIEVPGNESTTIPAGTTANQPSASQGRLRYDTTTGRARGVQELVWQNLVGIGATPLGWIWSASFSPSGAAEVVYDGSADPLQCDYMVSFTNLSLDSGSGTLIVQGGTNASTFTTSGYFNSGWTGTTGTTPAGAVGGGFSITPITTTNMCGQFWLLGIQGGTSGGLTSSCFAFAGDITNTTTQWSWQASTATALSGSATTFFRILSAAGNLSADDITVWRLEP